MPVHNIPKKPEGSAWTDDQWKAVATGGRNVLVAAAAGSGKTAVLVERIIRKISADTDVDRLLVATFTKAAAAEMKERIRIALEKALEREPDSEHLRRQLALMNRAAITTIHSFCLDAIRRYYPLIGLDPGFRIANETESELLRLDALDALFDEKYEDAGDGGAFLRLADRFGGERGDEPLYRLVQQLYEFSRSHPWPEHWLRETAAAFRVTGVAELSATPWAAAIRGDAARSLAGAADLLRQAKAVAELPDGPANYAGMLAEDLEVVERLRRAVDERPWGELPELFREAAFGKLKAVRGDSCDKALQEKAKELREQAKQIVLGMRDEWFGRPAEAFVRELAELAPLMEALAELVIEFGRRYETAKRERGLLDFGDLEHYCLRILRDPSSTPEKTVPSAAALEYRRQFEEVLLDEYQDTNTVQEAIVELISREGAGNRFMVGDVKQSIYRFRLAEPNLFLQKYKAYRSDAEIGGETETPADPPGTEAQPDHDGTGAPAGAGVSGAAAPGAADREAPGLRIDLSRNFRSRPEVVNGVNDVFRAIMRESVAEMDYDRSAELVCGASYPQPPAGDDRFAVELSVIDRGGVRAAVSADAGAADEDEAEEAARAAEAAEDALTAQLEARHIARRIRELADGGFRVYDGRKGTDRPLAWRDVVILLRATRQWAPVMIEELQAAGIPAYAELSTGYFDATEVEVMLSLLRVIDNPYQDIPLAGALRSPIFGLTAEELARIRIPSRHSSYYEAVLRAAGDLLVAEDTRRKLSLFLDRLDRWRDEARQGSLAELLWNIYRETGYYDWVGGLPGGAQRQANLRALYDRARQYEATSFRGLFRFLRFIDRMRESGGDLGTARELGEQEDVVRIMSIHKSKGLEFPVVFVAGLGKPFNQQDVNGAFLMHKELGFGPRYVDPELRIAYPTLPYLAVRQRMRMEMLAEEMRVLYVAMTRPKEKMILVATADDAQRQLERWRTAADGGAIPDYRLAAARCYLDWLGPLAAQAGMLVRVEDGAAEAGAGTFTAEPAPPVTGGMAVRPDEVAPQPGDRDAAARTDGASPRDGGDTAEAAPPLRDWRLGVVPAHLYGTEAAAASERNEAKEAELAERLQAVTALVPVEGGEDAAEIARRLDWAYSRPGAAAVAAKTSVTEMKRLHGEALRDREAATLEEGAALLRGAGAKQPGLGAGDGRSVSGGRSGQGFIGGGYTFRLRRPRFMEERSLTAAERGTVSHLLMQHVPLDAEPDEALLRRTVDSLVERLILTRKQAEAIDLAAVLAFFRSELGQRLRRAGLVRREMPFSCAFPAERVYPGAAEDVRGETVLIQGVVDCLFEDEGGLVLVDYKTDRIDMKQWDRAAERHRFQLELYADAIASVLGKPVTECYVFFLDGAQTVRLK